MVKGNLKQIDLLRKRRDSNSLIEPYFFDSTKSIKKGIFSGLTLIVITLILGIPFILRTKFLESKKAKIMTFSDEYDLLNKKLKKESKELEEISKFNSDLKNQILNISSSSALLQEIALIIPRNIQLVELNTKGNSLFFKSRLPNDRHLEILNAFLLNLDKSELVEFNDIDLKEIKALNKNSSDKGYLVEIKTKVSNKYSDINEKYLIKLGSFGLFNRLNIIKNLEKLS